jgi:hypothetical protein
MINVDTTKSTTVEQFHTGIDIETKDNKGYTDLQFASKINHKEDEHDLSNLYKKENAVIEHKESEGVLQFVVKK